MNSECFQLFFGNFDRSSLPKEELDRKNVNGATRAVRLIRNSILGKWAVTTKLMFSGCCVGSFQFSASLHYQMLLCIGQND